MFDRSDDSFTLAGHGSSITLTVLGYERETSSDFYDANWLMCRLKIVVGPFSGATNLAILTTDLESFYNELGVIGLEPGGAASFSPMEEVIQCTITMTKLGHARVTGHVATQDIATTSLVFDFESDQSFLSQTVADIELLVEKFPVRLRDQT